MNPESRPKRFGTTQPIFETPDEHYKIGRLVANATFFKALFRHGDFDEFHVFCPTHANCRLTRQRLEQEFSSEIVQKIRIHHIVGLPDVLKEDPFHVFHVGGWGFFWPGLIRLREKFACRPFPVTGLTHSLNSNQTPFEVLKVCTAPVRTFDSIICTSRCGREALQRMFFRIEETFANAGAAYRGRLDTLPLGIEDHFAEGSDALQSRKALGVSLDAVVVLYLGRISADSKLDPMPILLTLRQIIDAHPEREIRLLLAGGMDSASERVLADMISETRLQNHTQVFPNFEDGLKKTLYAASDIYFAPVDNLQETFGLTILEAMAHGCAVVASDLNGYSELISHGTTGIKIPAYWGESMGDMAELVGMMNFPTSQHLISQSIAVDQVHMYRALKKLVRDADYRRRLGESARQQVFRDYRWSAVIPQYMDLWEELFLQCRTAPAPGNPKKHCWWNVDYFGAFSHFPSRLLQETDGVRRSGEGERVLSEQKQILPYADVGAAIILPELIKRILKQMGTADWPVGKLTTLIGKHALLSPSSCRYTVLWMIKQGLLQRIETAPDPREDPR